MADNLESPKLRLYLEDAQAVDDLFQDALKARGRPALADMLNFLARFRRFSIFNSMLIRVQRPGAVAVASRHKWVEINRAVRPNAVPIIILQPFGPVEFVYEFGDTSGTDLPAFDAWDPFFAKGSLSPRIWQQAVNEGAKCGIAVETVANYGAALAGTTISTKSDQLGGHTEAGGPNQRFRIKINGKLEVPAQFATLSHELAHIYCGHLGGEPKNRWPDRSGGLTLGQRELEAEAAAWLVCRRNGIETRSAEYLSEHIQDVDLKAISIFAVMAAAHRIEARSIAKKGRAKAQKLRKQRTQHHPRHQTAIAVAEHRR